MTTTGHAEGTRAVRAAAAMQKLGAQVRSNFLASDRTWGAKRVSRVVDAATGFFPLGPHRESRAFRAQLATDAQFRQARKPYRTRDELRGWICRPHRTLYVQNGDCRQLDI